MTYQSFTNAEFFLLVQDILGGRSNQSRVANVSVKLTKKTNHLKQVISYMAFPIFFTICNTTLSYRFLRQSLRNFMLRSSEIIEVLGDGNLRCP